MVKFKKVIVLMLVMLMLAGFVGCGGEQNGNGDQNQQGDPVVGDGGSSNAFYKEVTYSDGEILFTIKEEDGVLAGEAWLDFENSEDIEKVFILYLTVNYAFKNKEVGDYTVYLIYQDEPNSIKYKDGTMQNNSLVLDKLAAYLESAPDVEALIQNNLDDVNTLRSELDLPKL